ncbi:MAG: substrate-binding domain-containing protein [Acidimicrobiales bacterium]
MRRVFALVAAVAMVAGSIALRGRLDRHEEDQANPLRIVCATELGPVCDSRGSGAQITVEPAARTADRLSRSSDGDPGVDGWLVPAPWPQIVDGRRARQTLPPLFADVGRPLARSRLVIVVRRTLVDTLGPGCGGTVGWKCLGDAAAASPPRAKPGHPDPATDAIGTLVVGHATAAYFGRSDDLSTFDLDNTDFARWFRALERATPPLASGGSPLGEMLGTNFAAYDAVGTIEAEAKTILETSAVRDRVVLSYAAPMATADVVLAGAGGDTARRLADFATDHDTRKALADAGWDVDGASRGGSQLPPTNGLPSPGFLDALRSRAEEVRR